MVSETDSNANAALHEWIAARLASAGAYTVDLAVSAAALADLSECPVGKVIETLKSPIVIDTQPGASVVLPSRCVWPIEPDTKFYIEKTESGVRHWLKLMADLNVYAMTYTERLVVFLDIERPAEQASAVKDAADAA